MTITTCQSGLARVPSESLSLSLSGPSAAAAVCPARPPYPHPSVSMRRSVRSRASRPPGEFGDGVPVPVPGQIVDSEPGAWAPSESESRAGRGRAAGGPWAGQPEAQHGAGCLLPMSLSLDHQYGGPPAGRECAGDSNDQCIINGGPRALPVRTCTNLTSDSEL